MPNPNRDDHHDVLDELHTEITTAEHPQARAAAARGLGALRTPAECFREALYVCAGIGLVRSALADPAPIVRAAAVEVLYEHCCARDAATARALYELITTDEDSQLRQTAFMALSACSHKGFRTWPESPGGDCLVAGLCRRRSLRRQPAGSADAAGRFHRGHGGSCTAG
ncbi:hypothetical protein IU409_20700 [Nocardia cyriacigeorgica]|uniref:HEAT repeat domain-containing protein n=1 Tax=Nocardia cyriacigeorgica TaxID=135487 RepID=UPI001895C262|nr:hypothetical protein [Nocardia cyriacigeorgica]